MWCIPPGQDAAFVAAMEDVLDVYARPPDPRRPLVCLDEGSKALHADAVPPLPLAPGQPPRIDPTYERGGGTAFFMLCAPHQGWRRVRVTGRRTARDWAETVRQLVDEDFPAAEKIVLVMDNLNTHAPASLYRAFPPAEAKRLWDKLEIHHTPKHGSWLNVAELELSVLARQCLDRRLGDRAALEAETAAWAARRNAAAARVVWQFTTADARTKLLHLYPALQPVR
jgi:DDE superfamily endonuclease